MTLESVAPGNADAVFTGEQARGILLSKDVLPHLASCGPRKLLDHQHGVGQPPLGYAIRHPPPQCTRRNLRAWSRDDEEQWPLLPFWMLYPDHCRFGDVRMRESRILQLDGADPFSA